MYCYECGYIEDKLFQYVKHSGSLSDSTNFTYEKAFQMQEQFQEINIETLKHMNIPDAEEYIHKVEVYYTRKKITVAFQYDQRLEAQNQYKYLKKIKGTDWKSFIKTYTTGLPFFKSLYKMAIGG